LFITNLFIFAKQIVKNYFENTQITPNKKKFHISKPDTEADGLNAGLGVGEFPVKATSAKTAARNACLPQTGFGVSGQCADINFKDTHHENQ
jgi:hypothetical protein